MKPARARVTANNSMVQGSNATMFFQYDIKPSVLNFLALFDIQILSLNWIGPRMNRPLFMQQFEGAQAALVPRITSVIHTCVGLLDSADTCSMYSTICHSVAPIGSIGHPLFSLL